MGSNGVRLHRWDEIALEKVTEMLSRKVVAGAREMLVQVYIKRGCLVPTHTHESEQMTYVLQGAIKFVVAGEEITVREGEVLLIPSNVELKLGVVTAFLGVPVFLVYLMRERRLW